ncbi:trimeric intracellular cation channel family protein [Deltaproteobacteria bacterium OttesenSCG-928-K17]|nr:trimeric intracellular cation channel family protein [Deltaproteobacteria bacterium OttesenSCG-928-K17]
MFSGNVDAFVGLINYLGIVAFAMSGALAAIRREIDIVGVLMLSLVACSCGGLVRDILIGDFPPELLRSNVILALAMVTGIFSRIFYRKLDRFHRLIDFFDALGLGLFAVVGANKALTFGITPTWCVGLGMITAIGGGIMRDIMLAQVPGILKSEIYATPAILGCLIMVAGKSWFPGHGHFFMAAGAITASGLRLMAIHYNWHIRR